jgi:hypothetical protein
MKICVLCPELVLQKILVQQKNLYSNKVCRLSSCSTIKQNLRTVLRIHHLQWLKVANHDWFEPSSEKSLKMDKDFAKLQLLAPAISGASTLCRIWVVRILWSWRLFDLWCPNISKRIKVLGASATSSCRNTHLICDTRDTEILWGWSGADAADDPSDFGDVSLLDLQSCTSENTRVSSLTLVHKDRVGSFRKTKEDQQAPFSS